MGGVTLTQLQREGVALLRSTLARYGGAILADSVGMGKTYVAVPLIGEALERGGGEVLVVVPAPLLHKWRQTLRAAGLEPVTVRSGGGGQESRLLLTSHTMLHRIRLHDRPALVVVDEAHQFRNPRTARYRALAHMVAGAHVLLLTATPVNNRLTDLYWLLRLFLGDGALANAAVPDLRTALLTDEHPDLARRVVARIVVRRTRADLPQQHTPTSLRFPRQQPPRPVRYGMPAALADVAGRITGLRLTAFDVGTGAGPTATDRSAAHATQTAALVRIGLLKRLESGVHAFTASITRLLRFLEAFEDAVRCGGYLRPRDARTTDPLQLSLTGLLARPLPRACDARRLLDHVHADCDELRHMRTGACALEEDPKVGALEALLKQLGDEPRVVFTEFADTAEALFDALPRAGLALLHGARAAVSGGSIPRRTVLERFAPRAHGAPEPPPHERVVTLIATDILSEGLDLQDARHCISYDLPWNPVRLMQRAGRIDRLGSLHEEVCVWYFEPTAQVERLLGLLRRLGAKVQSIARTVGAEPGSIVNGTEELCVPPPPAASAYEPHASRPHLSDPRRLRELVSGSSATVVPATRTAAGRAQAPEVPAPVLLAAWQRGNAWWAEGFVLHGEEVAGLEDVEVVRILTALHPLPGRRSRDPLTRSAVSRALAAVRAHAENARASALAARAADRIRRTLASCPGGPDAALCARADRMLRRLRTGVPIGAVWQLNRILQDAGTVSELFSVLEPLLRNSCGGARMPPPRLRAALLIEPPSG